MEVLFNAKLVISPKIAMCVNCKLVTRNRSYRKEDSFLKMNELDVFF